MWGYRLVLMGYMLRVDEGSKFVDNLLVVVFTSSCVMMLCVKLRNFVAIVMD